MKRKHFVALGHLDHGKSSLIGRLLWDEGRIGEETKQYLLDIGGAEGRHFAYVLDQKREERGRGITLEVGHNKLFSDGYSFTFSDVPGHETLLDRAYRGIGESDGAVLVVAADEGVGEQTRRHVQHALQCGIKDFIVCVNKMDKVGYDQRAFLAIHAAVSVLLPNLPEGVILPTSALMGENITQSASRMPWFDGKTFLQCLRSIPATESPITDLVDRSKEVISQAVSKYSRPVMLWAGGKDSTAQIAIAREMYGKLPFPVLFIDTTYKFTETYDFMRHWAKQWGLDFRVVKNSGALQKGVNPWSVSHFEYCHELKTKPLAQAVVDHGFDGVFTAIRWDEHGIRGKEQYFSPRENPSHTRIHPMLHWSEREIWEYIRIQDVPSNPLYSKEEHAGLVYRSIGCWPFTRPVPKDACEERSGRQLDKERLMEDLRSLGYM